MLWSFQVRRGDSASGVLINTNRTQGSLSLYSLTHLEINSRCSHRIFGSLSELFFEFYLRKLGQRFHKLGLDHWPRLTLLETKKILHFFCLRPLSWPRRLNLNIIEYGPKQKKVKVRADIKVCCVMFWKYKADSDDLGQRSTSHPTIRFNQFKIYFNLKSTNR